MKFIEIISIISLLYNQIYHLRDSIKIDKIDVIGLSLNEQLYDLNNNLTLKIYLIKKVNKLIKNSLDDKINYKEDLKHQCFGKNHVNKKSLFI